MNGNSAVATMRTVRWVAINVPYSPEVVGKLKGFELRAFDRQSRTWFLPAERAAEARALLQEHFGEVREEAAPRTAPAASQGPSRPAMRGPMPGR